MQPRIALVCALLGAPCLLAGCSSKTSTPSPTAIPNPAFPPLDVVDGRIISGYRDVADIADAWQRKNQKTNSHMTVADFETIKLFDILDHAKAPQTVLAVRDDLAHIRELNAMSAKKPRPHKRPGYKKRQVIFDSYTKWMKMAADIKAAQFNLRPLDRFGRPAAPIDLGPYPPTYEQAKKQALLYARQLPVYRAPA